MCIFPLQRSRGRLISKTKFILYLVIFLEFFFIFFSFSLRYQLPSTKFQRIINRIAENSNISYQHQIRCSELKINIFHDGNRHKFRGEENIYRTLRKLSTRWSSKEANNAKLLFIATKSLLLLIFFFFGLWVLTKVVNNFVRIHTCLWC